MNFRGRYIQLVREIWENDHNSEPAKARAKIEKEIPSLEAMWKDESSDKDWPTVPVSPKLKFTLMWESTTAVTGSYSTYLEVESSPESLTITRRYTKAKSDPSLYVWIRYTLNPFGRLKQVETANGATVPSQFTQLFKVQQKDLYHLAVVDYNDAMSQFAFDTNPSKTSCNHIGLLVNDAARLMRRCTNTNIPPRYTITVTAGEFSHYMNWFTREGNLKPNGVLHSQSERRFLIIYKIPRECKL